MAAVRLFFCGKQTEKGYLAVSEKNIYQPMGTTVVLTTSISDDLEILNIEWSIFTNFTFIARYTPTRTRIDWIPEYRGRLSLSTNNGSLEIKDLKIEDSRKYTCMIRFKQREEYKDGIELKVYGYSTGDVGSRSSQREPVAWDPHCHRNSVRRALVNEESKNPIVTLIELQKSFGRLPGVCQGEKIFSGLMRQKFSSLGRTPSTMPDEGEALPNNIPMVKYGDGNIKLLVCLSEGKDREASQN
ncbi:uncharacterized protein LOC120518333 isoform X4 [Polypterus senegalus]|uniref:uncharacterized protein LOC120518333 isoform X4 n=1 Tax=Polypterus senegalus TaxID=55291 RepID=UPI001964FA28|nr:uncharacterized protein LOC120518333 isoform X4 [Polypterus senegalus]